MYLSGIWCDYFVWWWACKPVRSPGQVGECLIWSIHQFFWCKHFLHDWSQATNGLTIGWQILEHGTVGSWESVWAGANIPQIWWLDVNLREAPQLASFHAFSCRGLFQPFFPHSWGERAWLLCAGGRGLPWTLLTSLLPHFLRHQRPPRPFRKQGTSRTYNQLCLRLGGNSKHRFVLAQWRELCSLWAPFLPWPYSQADEGRWQAHRWSPPSTSLGPGGQGFCPMDEPQASDTSWATLPSLVANAIIAEEVNENFTSFSWHFLYEYLIAEPMKAETNSNVCAWLNWYLHILIFIDEIACIYSICIFICHSIDYQFFQSSYFPFSINPPPQIFHLLPMQFNG